MKKQVKVMVTALFVVFQISVFGQTLNEKLKFLEPMLGKSWEGEMKSPDGKKSFKVTLSYESIWNGEAIKFSRTNKDLNFYQEGFFYWDQNEKQIKCFYLSNRGGANSTNVSNENGVITITGTDTMNDKKFDIKNTFEFSSNGIMTDRWFHNAMGSWRPGHVIEFKKID